MDDAQNLADALNGTAQLPPGMLNQLQQLQQQQQAAAAGAPPQQPVAFIRSPLGSGPPNALVDCNTKEGRKFHSTATRPLFGDGDSFDVEPSKFRTFVTKLGIRCKDLGFTAAGGMCMVPPDPADPLQGAPIDTVEDFGRANLELVRSWEETFIAADAGALGRMAQDSKTLFDILMNSLSVSGLARIKIWKHHCHIVVQGVACESGGCLLKVVVRESYLDSNAAYHPVATQFPR